MQLYALDADQPVLAANAQRHKDYLCPECHHPVRLKKGLSKQPHFFHRRSLVSCRQHQKSLAHLRIQLHLKSLIPEVQLEKIYPAIQRIADVAWESRKIVFEIQCSPISIQEVLQRMADYTSAGLQVVWVLSDRQFNKKKLTTSEQFLRSIPCYYFHNTLIYDQFDVVYQSYRLFKGPPLPVDLTDPLPIIPHLTKQLASLKKRRFSFQNDLYDRLGKEDAVQRFYRFERAHLASWRKLRWRKLYQTWVLKVLENITDR